MNILSSFSEMNTVRESGQEISLTIGNFDGIHQGHQKLLNDLVEYSRKTKTLATVLTFDPHPLMVLSPEIPFQRIMSIPHKKKILSELGIDLLVITPFTPDLGRMEPETFIRDILLEYFPLKGLVIGEGFRFGHKRAGSVADFQRVLSPEGVLVKAIPAVEDATGRVSSSRIRELLRAGRVKEANQFLTRPFQLDGTVEEGEKRGRKLGFPTLNIHPTPDRLLPASGVYVTRTKTSKGWFNGTSYVGKKPTFTPLMQPVIETHLFDFSDTLYGQYIQVDFLEFLRGDRAFPGPEALIAAISNDLQQSKDYFRENPISQGD
ncbi:bifunctional riboflavin kinase/FAD synthetase [Leptospirillum ferriphilum]|jgi:riboflavin kinase/FMN adenylyltransferase|uniref:Riboflavin biosynthesis protein n=2 Tax=Leptospirillum TaxID=179 RepID=J9ZEX7_LEPFM|nr:bifunctional riboflavin kinase/FAD synthetase [Leptospirillum ferriphilum]AFS54187.1 riboflavin kinase/FAD synthase(RibC) [Leptospirillum ferriphilum ML-04]EDZ40461.1 MAG: Riboflavin kinase / FAD synthase (RibC) [Leptospirillum sp. Group II '5-way CG']